MEGSPEQASQIRIVEDASIGPPGRVYPGSARAIAVRLRTPLSAVRHPGYPPSIVITMITMMEKKTKPPMLTVRKSHASSSRPNSFDIAHPHSPF